MISIITHFGARAPQESCAQSVPRAERIPRVQRRDRHRACPAGLMGVGVTYGLCAVASGTPPPSGIEPMPSSRRSRP